MQNFWGVKEVHYGIVQVVNEMTNGLRKLGNICCGHKMFLNKIRNIFCVPDTKFVLATNVVHMGKRGTFVSATMCLQQRVLVCYGLKIDALNDSAPLEFVLFKV